MGSSILVRFANGGLGVTRGEWRVNGTMALVRLLPSEAAWLADEESEAEGGAGEVEALDDVRFFVSSSFSG